MKKNLLAHVLRIPILSGFSIFAFVIASGITSAQITITSGNMPIAGKTYFSAKDTNVTNVGSAGPNQQWNFSGWGNHGIDTNKFVAHSSLAGYSSFPSSNLGLMDNNTGNIFLNNSSTSLDILGVYGNFGGGPAAMPFVPSQKFISFPSNYQTTYNGTTKYIMAFPNSPSPLIQ